MVMDTLESKNQELFEYVNDKILRDIYEDEFPLGTSAPLFTCYLN
jgi:hypothetical protein